jgi:mxaA protein
MRAPGRAKGEFRSAQHEGIAVSPPDRRNGMPTGRWLLLAAGCGALAAHAAAPQVEASEPRSFGYQVGDTVQRHVTVHAPDGWRLDEASLPRPGRRGQAIELRRVDAATFAEAGGHRHELTLEYQVFLAPAAVRTLELPTLRLRLSDAARSEDFRVEAWPVTVAPLVPVEVSPRRGLGELQPDRPPPPIDTAPLRMRLAAIGAAAVPLLGWLAFVYVGPRWREARSRPFGHAWRQLRRLPATADEAQWRAACRQLHEALDRAAGEVLFESGLERLCLARPAFAGLRDELARFLQLSRRTFFGGVAPEPGDAQWLVGLCRRLRDAERGSA